MVPPIRIRSKRRHAGAYRLLHRGLVRAGEMRQRDCNQMLGLSKLRHEAQPLHHRMPI
jgi:hypothetical protein